MRSTPLAVLCLSTLLIAAGAEAAPGNSRQSERIITRSLERSGSTRYYDWTLRLAGANNLPTWPAGSNVPGNIAEEIGLDARRHFVAVDDWGAAGSLRQLNSAVPVDVRWTSGEAWASDRDRFTSVVLVAVDGVSGATTRPTILQANGRVSLSPGTRALYAFFPDIGPLSDNRGAARLSLSDRSGRSMTMTVDARDNAISMEQTNALELDTSPSVANALNTLRGSSRDNFRNAGLRYALLTTTTAQGRHAIVVDGVAGQSLAFTPTTSQSYLAWVGFENVTDASGTVMFQWSAQTPTRSGAIPRSVWEDQWGSQREWDDSDWDWRADDDRWNWGAPASYDLQLRNLASGSQYTALLPLALEGVRTGDRVVVTGQLPRDIRAGMVRIYAANATDDDVPVRGTLTVGNLAVTAQEADAFNNRDWRYFTDDDDASAYLLAAGSGTVRSAVPAGTTFRLTLDVAPNWNDRRGEPITLYVGLAMAESGDRARTAAMKTFDAADVLERIPVGYGSGSGRYWDDDDRWDDRDNDDRGRGRGRDRDRDRDRNDNRGRGNR